MTPAEELTAAADRLDALLAGTTGAWEFGIVVDGGGTGHPVVAAEGDAAYIAAMNPGVGRALVALLRGMAHWDEINGMVAWPGGTDNFRDLARAILAPKETS